MHLDLVCLPPSEIWPLFHKVVNNRALTVCGSWCFESGEQVLGSKQGQAYFRINRRNSMYHPFNETLMKKIIFCWNQVWNRFVLHSSAVSPTAALSKEAVRRQVCVHTWLKMPVPSVNNVGQDEERTYLSVLSLIFAQPLVSTSCKSRCNKCVTPMRARSCVEAHREPTTSPIAQAVKVGDLWFSIM